MELYPVWRELNSLDLLTLNLCGVQSQDNYFNKLWIEMLRARNNIYLLGEDEPFFDVNITNAILLKAVERGVQVRAIVPEQAKSITSFFSVACSKLGLTDISERLQVYQNPNTPPMDTSLRIEEWGFDRGYMVIDNLGCMWNSKVLTTDPETKQQMYFRRQEIPFEVVQHLFSLIGYSSYKRDFEKRLKNLT